MPRYANGFWPDSALPVVLGEGYNSTDGKWHHRATEHTAWCWQELQRIALAHTGRLLTITPGFGLYRPYAAQVRAREIYGMGAAWPGASSHGGYWERKDSLAIDVWNWEWVYAKFGSRARAEFFADCRKAGFEPGLIHPSRGNGYPDEPWHIIDLHPFAPIPAGPTNVTPPSVIRPDDIKTEDELIEEALMSAIMSGFYYETTRNGKKTTVYLMVNNFRGTYHEFTNGEGRGVMPGEYVNPLSVALGTGSFAKITEGHARAIKNQNRATEVENVTVKQA